MQWEEDEKKTLNFNTRAPNNAKSLVVDLSEYLNGELVEVPDGGLDFVCCASRWELCNVVFRNA